MIPSALGVMGFPFFIVVLVFFLVYISIMQSINVKHKISYCFPKKCSFAARDFNNFIID